ncbi:hypothetical protein J19TS2_09930 [Cohnella xylanilytica]|uniref:Uncharacterized protein n=1 Tax=Cohnella xylanilytica TaxID=557555 RepID=A0A841U538_9BACL|nr:hypothetical protein [Cohnella xylanilytica]MBB6693124.1 hypothetical protein [Cohnella xylanilytica]GIO11438.1 hypothetical protein J19TS2_09930 [Cohnella xylanilytica]
MKTKKIAVLMLSVLMLLTFASAASAGGTPLSSTDTVTGQGTLQITGTAYFSSSSPVGVVFADVYRVVNGTEQLVESGRSNIYSNPSTVNFTINFNTVFSQGTYIIRYSYGGSLDYLSTYARFV